MMGRRGLRGAFTAAATLSGLIVSGGMPALAQAAPPAPLPPRHRPRSRRHLPQRRNRRTPSSARACTTSADSSSSTKRTTTPRSSSSSARTSSRRATRFSTTWAASSGSRTTTPPRCAAIRATCMRAAPRAGRAPRGGRAEIAVLKPRVASSTSRSTSTAPTSTRRHSGLYGHDRVVVRRQVAAAGADHRQRRSPQDHGHEEGLRARHRARVGRRLRRHRSEARSRQLRAGRGSPLRRGPRGGWVATGVLAVGAGVFGFMTLSQSSKLEDAGQGQCRPRRPRL